MSLLSSEAEQELAQSVLNRVDKLVDARIEASREFPYVQQAELLKDLKISTTYLTKLRAHGLKQVILEDGDRCVWYKKSDVESLMDELAQ
ncbi:hypothetical protein ACQUE4_07830 [Lactococcus lactis]|uniref:hypothetical protein n=1 Tax=Lactococcus lactis TaxID=1358 RepID=UPI003D13397E